MRILELASEHVRKYGASRLTVVAVATELGMSHANVYRYFPSKAALLEAATAQWLRPIENGMRMVAEGPDPARDKLERALSGLHRAYRDKMENDPELFEVLLGFFREGAGLARKHRARVLTEIRRVLEDGVANGAFTTDDPGRAVALVLDATHRFVHPLSVAQDRDVPRNHLSSRLDRVLGAVLNALAQRKALAGRHVG